MAILVMVESFADLVLNRAELVLEGRAALGKTEALGTREAQSSSATRRPINHR